MVHVISLAVDTSFSGHNSMHMHRQVFAFNCTFPIPGHIHVLYIQISHPLFLSDKGPMLDYTIRIDSTPTFLYFEM